ncbi:sugar MFS transporter [Marinigracilibium pacificum]|uniref:Sugar MFS transporter n=1 Tax=Marinigracilibium pacificum TaxID=2729599 RepID=A0A848J234_9BACT|nr:sugar MFS transporter [Marinigracilibium pacificum]NMM48369.1 sugar MFS transporter [Marinigracilibium pacificum]
MKKKSMAKQNFSGSLVAVTVLFFLWGFMTCMNDILIPHLKEIFTLKYWQAMLVQFCFFMAYFLGSLGYFILSLKKGDPINRIGYKNGIILGLIISGTGCLLFYPAANLELYVLFLSALFILGLGFTLLQIVANPYVSILGSPESASARLNMSQAFNSLGTTISPIVGGFLIFEYFFNDGDNSNSTKIPYLIFGSIFILMAIIFKFLKLPDFKNDEEISDSIGALKFPNLNYGTLAIFVYVGAEVSIGSFLINFTGLDHIAGLEESLAKNYLAYYWGGAMIGRFLGALSLSNLPMLKKNFYMVISAILSFVVIYFISDLPFTAITPFLIILVLNYLFFLLGKSLASRTLWLFGIVNCLLVLVSILSSGEVAMWALIGAGLFNSIMWSNIFTLGIRGLGKYTSQGSSLLVMAILGAAVLPLIQGVIADYYTLQQSFIIPFICYLYIIFYGFYCSRLFSNK